MNRRTFVSGLGVLAMAIPCPARTQPAGKVARIGILSLRKPDLTLSLNAALMRGLREHGYVEGKNLTVEFPDASDREERLPELAAGLVRSNVDVILIIGPAPLAAARKATTKIPLVMVASSADPVAEGVAVSLARPGGNITGLTYAEPDRFKKQLELLKSTAQRIARVAVLWDFDIEVFHRQWATPLAHAARVLGLIVNEPVRVASEQALPEAFVRMKHQQADALLSAAGGFLLPARATVAELATRHRLPAIAAFKQFPHAGLLMSYGPDLPDINRRAAGYVDRILKGARPGDLPIELPSKFEFVINQRTAKSIGLDIPKPLLLRANEVIQ
jgi:putative ABC transport system substrate-binding protein